MFVLIFILLNLLVQGGPVSDYTVEYQAVDTSTWKVAPNTIPGTFELIRGLNSGPLYNVRVSVTNVYGPSYSNILSSIQINPTAPSIRVSPFPIKQVVNPGGAIEIRFSIDGSPVPTIKWYRKYTGNVKSMNEFTDYKLYALNSNGDFLFQVPSAR
jgi:hypothetical protein